MVVWEVEKADQEYTIFSILAVGVRWMILIIHARVSEWYSLSLTGFIFCWLTISVFIYAQEKNSNVTNKLISTRISSDLGIEEGNGRVPRGVMWVKFMNPTSTRSASQYSHQSLVVHHLCYRSSLTSSSSYIISDIPSVIS